MKTDMTIERFIQTGRLGELRWLSIVLVASILAVGGCGRTGARKEFERYCVDSDISKDEFGFQFDTPSDEAVVGLEVMRSDEPQEALSLLTVLMLRRYECDVSVYHVGQFLPRDNAFVDAFYELAERPNPTGDPHSSHAYNWARKSTSPSITRSRRITRLLENIEKTQAAYIRHLNRERTLRKLRQAS